MSDDDLFHRLWVRSVLLMLGLFFWAGAVGGVIQLWRLIF